MISMNYKTKFQKNDLTFYRTQACCVVSLTYKCTHTNTCVYYFFQCIHACIDCVYLYTYCVCVCVSHGGVVKAGVFWENQLGNV